MSVYRLIFISQKYAISTIIATFNKTNIWIRNVSRFWANKISYQPQNADVKDRYYFKPFQKGFCNLNVKKNWEIDTNMWDSMCSINSMGSQFLSQDLQAQNNKQKQMLANFDILP